MKSQLLFLLALILVFISQVSMAATYTWTGSTNSNWSTNGNWSPSTGHPVAGDIVNIGTTTNKPTVDVNSACASITITGTTTLTLSATLTVSGALNVNGGANLTFAGSGSATFGGSSSVGNPSTLTTGASNTITFNGALSIVAGGNLVNNGNLNSNSATGISTGNPTTITNNSTGTITLTSSVLNLAGGTSLINSGNIVANSSSSIIGNNPSPITNNSTGSITLTASTMTLNGGSNITNSGAVSALLGSTITLYNPSFIKNITSGGSLTLTVSLLDVEAGGSITNSGTITANLISTIELNGNPSSLTNNINGIINASASIFSLVAGASITNTGGAVNMSLCAINCSGNPSTITNQNSGSTTGTFTLNDTFVTLSGSNSVVNYGTFTANNNSNITLASASVFSAITNYGTFYAGTSNSPCNITLTGNSPKVTNGTNTVSGTTYNGTFYLGSTSILYPTSTSCLVTNSASCTFILQSDAYGSAAIGAVPAGANPNPSIVGTFNVERYVTGGNGYRGYRLLSSPVYGSTDANSNKIYSVNYLKNSMYLTGTTGISGGFDKAGNPTIYFYRENIAYSNATFISGNCRGLNTIGTAPNYNYLIDGDAGTFNIPAGNGLIFFFRGDRSQATLAAETTTTYVPTNATLTATGTLNQQQVVVHDWYTPSSANLGWTNITGNSLVQGYNLVGNPYASSIDWEQYNTTTTTSGIYANNIGTTVYELNPATGNYDTYQKGGAHTNQGSNIIASGQAFFVRASNNSSPQLIFNESAKTNTLNTGINLLMTTRATVTNTVSDPFLRVQLAKDSINTDDVYISFNATAKTEYAPDVDAAYKIGSGKVGLSSLSSDNMAMAIYKLPLPKQSQTIKLNVSATSDGIYKLNLTEQQAIPTLYEVWLMDSLKKDSLDLRHNSTYNFNLALGDTSTYGSNRFSLVIRQNPALGLHLLNFTAVRALGGVQVNWRTENEQNTTNFSVERSTDKGTTFNAIGGLISDAQGTYGFLDINPVKAVGTADEYRLKLVDLNGTISYSKIVTLNYTDLTNALAANNMIVYPNPASGTVHVTLSDQLGEQLSTKLSLNATQPSNTVTGNTSSYTIRIVNIKGAVLKTAVSLQPNWQDDVTSLLPGTYFIQVTNNANKSLVGRSSFVKL